jgi:hypothetical protein
MPAYSILIPKPKCGNPSCIQKATHEVFNSANAPCGYRCRRCAPLLLRHLDAEVAGS